MDVFILAIAALIFLDLAAARWGVDTRSWNDDPRYPSAIGLS